MASALKYLVRGYQVAISPWLPPSCRFHPTCSHYALSALEHFGAIRGCWLTVVRIMKCHPFHPGGLDPIPDRPNLNPPPQP